MLVILLILHVVYSKVACTINSNVYSGGNCACIWIVSKLQEVRKGLEEDCEIYLHYLHPHAIRLTPHAFLHAMDYSYGRNVTVDVTVDLDAWECLWIKREIPLAIIHLESVTPFPTVSAVDADVDAYAYADVDVDVDVDGNVNDEHAIAITNNLIQKMARMTKIYVMINPEIPIDPETLYGVNTIIVKTRYAEKVMNSVVNAMKIRDINNNHDSERKRYPSVLFLSHTSLDRRIKKYRGTDHGSHNIGVKSVKNTKDVLFIGGESISKHVISAVKAWKNNPSEFPKLIVTRFGYFLKDALKEIYVNGDPNGAKFAKAENITLIHEYISEMQIWKLMNVYKLQICSGFTEGFGHTLNGARSVSAVIIAPDLPPFNELLDSTFAILIPPEKISLSLPVQWYENNGIKGINITIANVNEFQMAGAVKRLIRLDETKMLEMGEMARNRFESDRLEFHKRIQRFLFANCHRCNSTITRHLP